MRYNKKIKYFCSWSHMHHASVLLLPSWCSNEFSPAQLFFFSSFVVPLSLELWQIFLNCFSTSYTVVFQFFFLWLAKFNRFRFKFIEKVGFHSMHWLASMRCSLRIWWHIRLRWRSTDEVRIPGSVCNYSLLLEKRKCNYVLNRSHDKEQVHSNQN